MEPTAEAHVEVDSLASLPALPEASLKDNPVQDVRSTRALRRSHSMRKEPSSTRLKASPPLPKKDAREVKETKEGTAKPSPPLRRLRAVTLSVSAPQLVIERTHNGRERSNSFPYNNFDASKDIDTIWNEVMEAWDETYSLPGKLTAILYKRGLPDARRPVLWARISKLIPNTALLRCSEENEGIEHKCIYKKLLSLKDTSHEHQITADITRTFPSEQSIYAPEFQQSLFNVLKAFSLYDPNVGYCQGLSFVAAMLLMHIKEEQAFFMLIRLLKGHNLRSIYTEDMRGVKLRMYQINKLSEFLFPEMHKHMEDLGVSISVITTPWLMTAFGYQLPLEVAMRVADVVLYEGIPALFRIALAVLVLCEKEIMELSVDEVMDYFRTNLRTKFQDPQQLMTTAYAVNISQSQLESLEFDFLQSEALAEPVESEFGKKSKADIEELENNVRYSQELVNSHELKEILVGTKGDYDNLNNNFEQFKKKAESEKVALIERLGKLLDKLNIVEDENNELTEKLRVTENSLSVCRGQCVQMTQCSHALAQEVHKLKQKLGTHKFLSSSS